METLIFDRRMNRWSRISLSLSLLCFSSFSPSIYTLPLTPTDWSIHNYGWSVQVHELQSQGCYVHPLCCQIMYHTLCHLPHKRFWHSEQRKFLPVFLYFQNYLYLTTPTCSSQVWALRPYMRVDWNNGWGGWVPGPLLTFLVLCVAKYS